MKLSNKVLIALTTFLLVACNFNGSEGMPGIDIPFRKMNTILKLSAPSSFNTFKIGDDVGLVLINYSDIPVLLPQDYAVQIYQDVDNKWVPIQNLMAYPPGENLLYPREDKPFREVVLVVYPNVLSDQPVKIRIVIVGNYYNETNGTKEEPVGAYVDVHLKPK